MVENKRKSIIFLLFFIVLVVLLIWILQIVNDSVPYIDRWTRGLVETLGDSAAYQPFRFITELGSRSFLFPFVIMMAIVLWVLIKDMFAALVFAGGTLATHLLNIFIKNVVNRERPSISVAANAEGYSFPSGHAMIPMVCYGLLAYFLVKRMKLKLAILMTQVFFALVIFLIGISRYVINVHYITDVMAGFVIGFICLVGFIYFYEFVHKYWSQS
ncbi:phosphatase PAP2 family protein [Oceanobacillus saliphilus]|uniref:phosphatase PAP2 family protein n=1 Tax=Oceanobacillus saliphilus TaxID=2925834 RepID=UPI00201D6832|nr:phosphatase PAP2 family protein [Oceanobacillus saliphilus]